MADPYYMAAQLVGCEVADLPDDLYKRLKRIETYSNKLGGGLYSRQIVSLIVDGYLMEKE